MARRGVLLSDSDDSDVSEDDDVSDAEDTLLRQRVREAATRGGGHTTDLRGDRGERAGASERTAGGNFDGEGARTQPRNVPHGGGPSNTDRVNTHTNTSTNTNPTHQVDDDEREVLCTAIGDDNTNAPRQVPGVNSGQIGPELKKLRAAQGEHAEYYTLEHYDRLYGRRRPWGRDAKGSKVWCKDVHGPGCRECTSCHFCRQKTSDLKTRCQCGEWRKQPPGGRGRGAWCGWCLEMRMGENITEALVDEEWRCPVCRDICNCSGANCLRAKRNLFPTQQLTHEAEQFGWQSVAHYLITTRISEHDADSAPPILQLPRAQREQFMRRRNQIGGGTGSGGISEQARRRRTLRVEEEKRRRRASALRDAVTARLRVALGVGGGGGGTGGVESAGVNNANGTAVGASALFDGNSSGSSGSDLDSNDDDDDDRDELMTDGVEGGFGDVGGDQDMTEEAPGQAPNSDDPISIDIDEPNSDIGRSYGQTGTRPVGRQASSAQTPLDDDTVPDSQSDEEDEGRRQRGGGGGGGGRRFGGGGGGGGGNRHAKRPRLEPSRGAPHAPDTIAPFAAVDLTQSTLRDASNANATVSHAGPSGAGGQARSVDQGRRHQRNARRRNVTNSRRVERKAERRFAREQAQASAETVRERELAAGNSDAAHALRDALAVQAVNSPEDEVLIKRCLDQAFAAVAASEAAEFARAARFAVAKRTANAATRESDIRGEASAVPPSVNTEELTQLDLDLQIATNNADTDLNCFSALVVYVSRVNSDVCSASYEQLVGGADAADFRNRSGVRRATVLRTVLRSLELMLNHACDAEAKAVLEGSDAAAELVQLSAEKVTSASTALLGLLAVLGEEFCLLREHARWRAGQSGGDDGQSNPVPSPPPLPTALLEFIGDDATVRSGEENGNTNNTSGSTASDAAERLLTKMEECHVLLAHALKVVRRFVGTRVSSVSGVEANIEQQPQRLPTTTPTRIVIAPGVDTLLSPTLAAFLHPRYPFRSRLRKRALSVIAAASTAVRQSVENFDGTDGSYIEVGMHAETMNTETPSVTTSPRASHSALAVATALNSTVWPALSALLECDHPARKVMVTRTTTTPPTTSDSMVNQSSKNSSGCPRAVIETTSRVVVCLLKTSTWTWGRAEREITQPHPDPAVFWKLASAPYRALALRLYSRLCTADASPVLASGAGVPLLKLWALATSDPAANEGGGGDGVSVGGFGRARARLAKCVRRHPGLGTVAMPVSVEIAQGNAPLADPLISPAAVSLETRASWIREAIARLVTEGGGCSAAALAVTTTLWDITPSRVHETVGSSLSNQWHDLVCAVVSAAVRTFAIQLHKTPRGGGGGVHDFGKNICVGQSDTQLSSKLTAMCHLLAVRHNALTANASSAKSVCENALAAAAYAGSSRAEACLKNLESANLRVAKSLEYFADAFAGIAHVFQSGSNGSMGQNSSYVPVNDAPLIGCVVALCHAGWERGPPRAPSLEHRDAAVDAVRSVTQNSKQLNSFIQSAIVRRALLKCVPNRVMTSSGSNNAGSTNSGSGFLSNVTHGGHMYPPGCVAGALHTIQSAKRCLQIADRRGTVPETLGDTFCVLSGSLLDVLNPPPPPPDPRRSAPPSGAQAAPPVVRQAVYQYLTDVANARPNACGGGVEGSAGFASSPQEYLRYPFADVPVSILDSVVHETLRAAIVCASSELATSSGFKGAKAAAMRYNSKNTSPGVKHEHGDTRAAIDIIPTDVLAFDAIAAAHRVFRTKLGSHAPSGQHEEVLKRFKPTIWGGCGSDVRSSITDGAKAQDVSIGKDFDVANGALAFLNSLAKINTSSAKLVTKLAMPALCGALSDDGDARLRRYTRSAVCDLWDTVRQAVGDSVQVPPTPLTPPEAPQQRPGHPNPPRPGATQVFRSSRDALNAGGASHSARPMIHKKTPWPANVSDPLPFSNVIDLCEKVSTSNPEAKKTKVSVIGAVVGRDPKTGTKLLKNPKTNREYAMVFLTLADHTGKRVKAQLLGEKAKKCAETLDRVESQSIGGSRTVVGLCDVLPRATVGGSSGAPSSKTAVVWDPKETSVFVCRPEHALASKL